MNLHPRCCPGIREVNLHPRCCPGDSGGEPTPMMLLWGFGMRTYTCDAARGIREVNLGRTGRCSALPGLTKHLCEILQLVVCCLSDIRRTGWSRIEVQLESNKHFQGSRDHWQCHCPHSKVTICFSIRCGPEGSPQRSCPLTPITRSKPKVIKPL